jgi:hypothetical protein
MNVLILIRFYVFHRQKFILTPAPKTATIAGMELAQLKSLFVELKLKASDLRGFL